MVFATHPLTLLRLFIVLIYTLPVESFEAWLYQSAGDSRIETKKLGSTVSTTSVMQGMLENDRANIRRVLTDLE